MTVIVRLVLCCCLLPSVPLFAQAVIANSQSVAADTPEAWAMRYFAGTTLMTSVGETAKLAPWHWNVAFDLGSIPPLSESQQRVGFGGFKNEDLNKSPLFGRLRLGLGVPGDWVAELGYTPPLEIDGSRARNVLALAIGRRLVESDAYTLSVRALGQVGKVQGDITCPARLAGVADPTQNPYRCQAPSQDTFTTKYAGVDATSSWRVGDWSAYVGAGMVRAWLSVQVDALLDTYRDRSRLTSNSNLPWLTLGVRHDFDPKWSIAAELLYVPLDVRRPPDYALDKDPLTSVRMQLRYSVD